MKKTKLAILMGAILWGAAIGTTSAAVSPDLYATPSVADLIARKGADDPRPPKCDDHGTDLCKGSVERTARHGADDPRPPKCDDHGTDLCKEGA